MLRGKRKDLKVKLKAESLSGLVQTAFIERVNPPIRQEVAPLMRKTWSLAQTEEALLLHLEWWRLYYYFVRPHSALKLTVRGSKKAWRAQTPAMAAGLVTRLLPDGGSE